MLTATGCYPTQPLLLREPSTPKAVLPYMAATKLHAAKTVGAEDLRVGDYVTFLHVSAQYASFCWCDQSSLSHHEPVRVTYLPVPAGVPMKVQSICLPFVLATGPNDKVETIDVRQCRLGVLDKQYAKSAWKALKKKKRN